MLEKMLFTLPAGEHSEESIRTVLMGHPEVRFVSLVGVDSFGHDTDEKIPIEELLSDPEKFLSCGVQTDGSSVLLPEIADVANARVDLRPDRAVNWYVDHNFYNIDERTGLPVGTLRIPAYLVHNDKGPVGSRSILGKAEAYFKKELLRLLEENPYIFEYLPFSKVSDIKEVLLTAATEMEFYVKTPRESADRERLHTSQELKEQYWKRTIGPVRTALENSIIMLNMYGMGVEMGHKETGGVKAELGSGGYDHIMEQLEINWRYDSPMQTADNDRHARYVIQDCFRRNNLDVSFLAKPVEGVVGSGKHTHFGVAALLKDGRKVNLFSALNQAKDYMNPIGFGALMGLLKNYEVISPFANATNDAFNRLKPGYEAPVSIAASLGRSVETASRNRTVLVGLIRDMDNSLATHFELRSPNPRSNSYMVMTSTFAAMLSGITAALEADKTPDELTDSISKHCGEEDFYLEKDRVYRSENNIFDDYTAEERDKYFGKSPETVWESVKSFDLYPEKTAVLLAGNIMSERELLSFKAAVIEQWSTELRERIIPGLRARAAGIVCRHSSEDGNSLDEARWSQISIAKAELFKDTADKDSMVTMLKDALAKGEFDKASDLQIMMLHKMEALDVMYTEYSKNIL